MKLTSFVFIFFLGFISIAADAQQTVEKKDMQAKLCILSAAQNLPRIIGMEIIASRSIADRDLDKSVVEIDFKAAAQAGTFSFACTWGIGKPTVVSLIGLTR